MERETYEKTLHENITKGYMKTYKKTGRITKTEDKKIAEDLELKDRIDKMQESEWYVTVKNQEEAIALKISF